MANISDLVKHQARELLAGVEGVQGIGFGWDRAGNRVLQVDISPRSDYAGVQQRLSGLDMPVRVRQVSGTLKREVLV